MARSPPGSTARQSQDASLTFASALLGIFPEGQTGPSIAEQNGSVGSVGREGQPGGCNSGLGCQRTGISSELYYKLLV